ncbi:hypothetical protein [Paenibacillus sp. SI8]|uniref:WapI family immunity protein n=1 Tax=unclassified Paenibacillus TaxID=185978 RepID=UPI00346609F5
MDMEQFKLTGEHGYIVISIEEVWGYPSSTSHFGGYDTIGTVELKSGNYKLAGELWFTTGEVYSFYSQLGDCYKNLQGTATFCNHEMNLTIEVAFSNRGQVIIRGSYKEQSHVDNELRFEFHSDQSYIAATLKEIECLVEKYGDMKGKKV